MGAANRHAGREHFPRYPKGWIVLRIFQLIFSIAINGLCGYSLAYLSWSGTYVMAFTVRFEPPPHAITHLNLQNHPDKTSHDCSTSLTISHSQA